MKLPRSGSRTTLIITAYAIMALLWLGLEDTDMRSVVLLGVGGGLLTVNMLVLRFWGGKALTPRQYLPGFIVYGACIGAASVICTVLLMFFKTGWHQHGSPDYPPLMMWAMAQRLPIWALAGALFGLATSLIFWSSPQFVDDE